jgi:hypothetical protein
MIADSLSLSLVASDAVGTFVGTILQNGGKWRAFVRSIRIRDLSVSD